MVEMYLSTNFSSQYLLIRQLLPTSELPTLIILKHTWSMGGMQVKFPLGVVLNCYAGFLFSFWACACYVSLYLRCCGYGSCFFSLFAFFVSWYSLILLMRSFFSKQSSLFMPNPSRICLSSFALRAVRFDGISTNEGCLVNLDSGYSVLCLE